MTENPADNPENPQNLGPDSGDSPRDSAELSSSEPAEVADQAAPPAPARAAARRPMMRRSEKDWPAMKRLYVEGEKDPENADMILWPTLDAVGERFGTNPSRVRERAAREGWRAQRTQWQAQVEATRQQARAAALARSATEVDGRALDATKLGLSLCLHRLGEIAKQRDVVPIDAQEQQRLATAVDLWHKIGLRAVGDPETHRIELTGANGAPIEIATELRRDDADRLAGVLGVLRQAGVGDLFTRADAERVIDVDVLEDDG